MGEWAATGISVGSFGGADGRRETGNGGLPSRGIASRCLPFLSKVEQPLRVGDRTSTALDVDRLAIEAMVTVAGLCRIHTGFAALQRVVL
jgi:hypothetical protein